MSGSSARPSPRARRPWLIALGLALLAIVVAVVVVFAGAGSSASPVAALPGPVTRTGPESIFTAGAQLKNDPVGTIAQLKALGVDRIRIFLTWNELAPAPTAIHRPARFDATDPAAYPAAGWVIYDKIIRDTLAQGLGVDVVLGPPPPRWASAPGAPQPAQHTYWRPSAADFEQFVQAVGTRYSGHYVPPGAGRPLPRVAFWSIWNEPNAGFQLAPQATHDSKLEVAPLQYRRLADAAWTGLRTSGHVHDTTLIGELAPAGSTVAGAPGNFAVMAPLRFLRALYCVGANYRPLRGRAASARGCPPTGAGSARFADAHPVLFKATAFADHPYPQGLPPDVATPDEPDFAELAAMPKLFGVLDMLQRAYGSDRRLDVYSTEFGYQTSPPDRLTGVSPALAARYLNWSEYLTWREPRLRSYNQYLLTDPAPAGTIYRGFASGLDTYAGVPKPSYYAYRMPIYLPVQSTARHHPLAVWGCVRPAHSTPHPARAQIQFRSPSAPAFRTVATAAVNGPYCYFYEQVTFPSSGFVRLRWSDPHGPVIFSRTVSVTVG